MYMKKYYNRDKKNYWNDTVIFERDTSLNQDIISEIEDKCKYNIIEINNYGKSKKNKNICVKNRDIYTRHKLNRELPYLKEHKHLISINPPGKKYLFFLNNFANKKNSIFINRYKDEKLNYEHQVIKILMNLDEELYKGTLFDGQVVKKKDDKWYFVINDIYMYKGNNIMNNNFLDRLEIIKQIFNNTKFFKKLNNPYVDCYKHVSEEVIYFEIKLYLEYKFGNDLATNYYKYLNYYDNNEKFQNNDNNEDGYNGDIPKGILFTNIDINATQIYYILPLDENKSSMNSSMNSSMSIENNTNKSYVKVHNKRSDTTVGNNSISKSKSISKSSGYHIKDGHNTIGQDGNYNTTGNNIFFELKKNKCSDVYYLFCKKDDIIIEYGLIYIKDVISSHKINSYFKINVLDFNNQNENYKDEVINVRCEYNSKYKKWIIIEKVKEKTMSNYDEIKFIEENNKYEHPIISNNIIYTDIAEFNKGEYLIYNEYNEEVSIEFVENILNKYGVKHKISDENLIKNAFVSKTYSKEYYIKGYNKYGNGNIAFKKAFNLITKNIKDNDKKCIELYDISNERLEWFGDAKLSEIISPYLEHRYPNEDEGFLTKIRSKLIRKQTLAELGMKLGLNKYILMAKQIEVYEECRTSVDLTEDCFEALIGSLSKEFKQQKCEYKLTQFLINLYEEEIDFVNIIVTDDNYKTKLMEYYHKIVNKTPYYQEEDNDENLCKVNVYEPVNKQIIGHGTNKIKKKAEQIAARNALIYLRLI